jgi:hypothetical protein
MISIEQTEIIRDLVSQAGAIAIINPLKVGGAIQILKYYF